MLFVEFRFFLFFLVAFCLHWALPTHRAQKLWLLACSYFFYACFFIGDPVSFVQKIQAHQPLPEGWWFPAVLLASTTMDFFVGIAIADAASPRSRRFFLFLSLLANLGVLAFFKYFNFFLGSASAFLGWLGLPASDWTLKILLPYGVSFYTFQSMSYSIDVFRRQLAPVRNFFDLAFFISFFPQLVAGPIVRASVFLPQVFVPRQWAQVDVRAALLLFLLGFIKKACLSENVAPVADAFFNAPASYDVFSSFIGVAFYAIQIYCDFSGYTDMALATAALLGYQLTENFRCPYFASNIAEFWRRWHISLSSWLRDYLYISLGGNRGSKLYAYRNLFLTMLLGGLWHGASWTFVIWGALHGLALIVHREWLRLTANAPAILSRSMAVLGPLLTFYWVCFCWIFFRSQPLQNPPQSGFDVARTILHSFLLGQSNGKQSFPIDCLWFFLALAAIHWITSTFQFTPLWRRLPPWLFVSLLALCASLAILFVPLRYKAFIYFQF